MEILSIITERPDQLALSDVGGLPTKHLSRRQQQVHQDRVSGARRLITGYKDEKGAKQNWWVMKKSTVVSKSDSQFSQFSDSLRSGYM